MLNPSFLFLQCPVGLYFDLATWNCNWPAATDCGERPVGGRAAQLQRLQQTVNQQVRAWLLQILTQLQ